MVPGEQSESGPMEPTEQGNGRVHDEQCVQYTHEMPYELKESFGRVIIRLVPLLYGFMFGGLTENMPVSLSIGVLVSTALDLGMGEKSLFLGFFGSLSKRGCPVIAALARVLAWGIGSVGMRAPKALANMRCGMS